MASRVVGIGRDRDRLEQARILGAIDDLATDWATGLADADVIVVCTPVDRIAQDVIAAGQVRPDCPLITDAGSTKLTLVETIDDSSPRSLRFVGAHPIAGSEQSGVAHARPNLFLDRTCVLTPTERTPLAALERAREFWTAVGCRLIEMSPAEHDRALARTSHLPHVVASVLAAGVPPEWLPLAAGAFRDGTRVAAADPDLWSAILLQNRSELAGSVRDLVADLGRFLQVLAVGDPAQLRDWWLPGQDRRRQFDRIFRNGADAAD